MSKPGLDYPLDGIPAHYREEKLSKRYHKGKPPPAGRRGICVVCGRNKHIAAKGMCSRDYARSRSVGLDVKPSVKASETSVKASDKPSVPREKSPAAVALGRMGGLKGGKARAAILSADRRKEIAQLAAKARWAAASEASA